MSLISPNFDVKSISFSQFWPGAFSQNCWKKPRPTSTDKLSPVNLLSTINRGSYNRGSYTSAHVLLNLLNELGKRDKMRGLPSILSLFRNEFNRFNNTRAQMLDSIYRMALKLLSNLISAVKTL